MKEVLNVLYQSNDNYAPITGVSLTSLLINSKDIEEINVYVLDDKISAKNIKKLKKTCEKFKRNIYIIDTDKILHKLKDELKVAPLNFSFQYSFVKNLEMPISSIIVCIPSFQLSQYPPFSSIAWFN